MIPWFFPHNDYVCWGPAFQEVAKHLPPNGKQGINSSFCFAYVCNLLLSLLTYHYLDPQVFSSSFYFPLYHEREWLSSCVSVWVDPSQQLPWLHWQNCSQQVKRTCYSPAVSIHDALSKYCILFPTSAPKNWDTDKWDQKKKKKRGSLSRLGGWCTWHTKKSYTELGFLILERLLVRRGRRVGGCGWQWGGVCV